MDSRRLLSPQMHLEPPQFALVVAVDADDRVEQPVDRQLARGDGVGDGIDQERHVVVDDGDAHAPMASLAAGGFDGQVELAALAAGSNLREKFHRLALVVAAQSLGFAGKRVSGQRLSD